jgi:uncharacterized protein YcfL
MMTRIPFFLAVAVLGAVALVGCSSSTDPKGDGSVEVVYTPSVQFLEIVIPETRDFSVSTSQSATLSATWFLNGAQVGVGNSYQFQSQAVGYDTLTVETVVDDHTSERDWRITVLPSPSLAPPPIQEVLVQHGELPMDVRLSWHWISNSAYPMIDYVVASSYEGPVTDLNWESATLLGEFPHVPDQVGYTAIFTAAEHGMLPGADIWFGIRGRDDRGQMSHIEEPIAHTISFAWWIDGTVYDTRHNTLQEIIIDYGCGSCRVNTDGLGEYRVGPFRNLDTVNIYTLSWNVDQDGQPFTSWYDYRSEPIVYSESSNTHDIYLINRYGMDDLCMYSGYDQEFLKLFRWMTQTHEPSVNRQNCRLFKWEDYPVKVYIPDHVVGTGLDFGENTRTGAGYWNLIMEEDYLVEVDDPALAQIEFYFGSLSGGNNGVTFLLEPTGSLLGDVIPEKIRVGVNDVILTNPQRIQETVLHELGHALGLNEHVSTEAGCNDVPYLMRITSAGALNDGYLNAVHVDEIRMIQAIRNLPQGVDMARFILE